MLSYTVFVTDWGKAVNGMLSTVQKKLNIYYHSQDIVGRASVIFTIHMDISAERFQWLKWIF